MFNALSSPIQIKEENSQEKISTIDINSIDSKHEQLKSYKPTKLKRIINKELEENQNQPQQSLSKVTVEKQSDEKDIQNETDTNTANVMEE
jgi:hypothetical protein